MGYFVIIIYTTFLGSPPELLPIAFKGLDGEKVQELKDFLH